MTKKDLHRKRRRFAKSPLKGTPPEDVKVVQGQFTEYLRSRHFSPLTIEHHQRRLVYLAFWLSKHRHYPSLGRLTRRKIPRLLAHALAGRTAQTRINYWKAVLHWVRFNGGALEPIVRPWASWVTDYLEFLRTHRGVGPSSLDHSERNARAFMDWQFGNGKADWSTVRPTHIWSFACRHVRGVKPVMGKSRLGYVRRFLLFVHFRGACGAELAAAIPKVAVHRVASRPEVLSEQQRRKLLASFDRTTPEGKRNYAMTLCMLDLGMRGVEVRGLRLEDIDWRGRRLNIRPFKTGRGRQLPLPPRILDALQDYVRAGRPKNTGFDHVFLMHPRRRGHPLSRSSLKAMAHWAYRRCGFPPSWSGTHRLRHTFASRLYRRGVDMKPIADLLGHKKLDSTNIYTQVDIKALRPLAKPWPWST